MAIFVSLLISAVLVGFDQLTKYLAVLHLKGQSPIALWPEVFELQYCANHGVAFSLLEDKSWIFIPVTILAMLLVMVVLARSSLCRNWLFRSCCILILAGGIGNLIDRIALGYVVDFLYFKLINFPIFNFADCCVVVGAIALAIYLLFVYKDNEETSIMRQLFGVKKRVKEPTDG